MKESILKNIRLSIEGRDVKTTLTGDNTKEGGKEAYRAAKIIGQMFINNDHYDSLSFIVMDRADPLVPPGQLVAQGRRAVRGTVVHQQHLKVGLLLGQDGIHTAGKVAFRAVDRNDKGIFQSVRILYFTLNLIVSQLIKKSYCFLQQLGERDTAGFFEMLAS